jgi:hypothetical protein
LRCCAEQAHFPFVKQTGVYWIVDWTLIRRPENRPNLSYLNWFHLNSGKSAMRIARLIFVGSTTVMAALLTSALAKNASLNSHANANAQKADEQPAAQACHAYQEAADGSWVQLPCQEVGPTAQAPTRGKSATRAPDEQTR